jgi:hypothetical protein
LAALIVSVLAALAVTYVLLRNRAHQGPPSGSGTTGFREIAAESGITFRMFFLPGEQGEKFKTNLYDHGSGVAVADYDSDGHDDIYFVNQLGPNALYRNKGDGTFVEVTREAGVALDDRICVAAAFADYDNDGDQDLFVTSTRGGNVLFRNEGNGTFRDVTREAGLAHVGHSSAATFFDFDRDGDLDLFVGNTGKWTLDTFDQVSKYFPGKGDLGELAGCPVEDNILYRNNGDGTFTDVTAKAGLKGMGWGGDIAAFDFNEDGYPDLLVTNMFGRSQLYRNNGDGTFTDVTLATLGRTPWGGMGVRALDFNNDGKLDLYIVDMHSDMWTRPFHDPSLVQEKKKYPHVNGPLAEPGRPRAEEDEKFFADLFRIRYDEVLFGNAFYKNLGGGKFVEMSDRAGLETFWPWGVVPGDFDNDGYEDVFVPSGMGYPFWYWPNYLMRNNGDETFTDRAGAEGIEPPPGGHYLPDRIGGRPATRSSRCAAAADFDGDGRLEIIVNNFNDHPYYFKNNFSPKNHVAFRLRGTKGNRDAIGAVVRLYAGGEVMTRQLHGAGGYLSQSSKTVHFGLGDHTRVDRVEIQWPGGALQTIESPALNVVHTVSEPEG